MSASIVDRYMELKDPDRLEEVKGAAAEGSRLAMERKGIKPEELPEIFREGKRQALAQHDTSILEEAGLTVEELLRIQERESARKNKSGSGPAKRLEKARDAALRSFIVSEIYEHSHPEAVEAAMGTIASECGDDQPDEKTVSGWLRTLQRWRVTTIPAPKPGRPKK